MFHILKTEFDFIEETLLEYDIQGYLIGQESDPYDHFHILFQGTDTIYNAFSKRLIEKYNLRGKAGKDASRQYGKIKTIKDIEKLKSYTIKNKNYKTNLTKEEVEKILEASFKKSNVISMIDEIALQVVEMNKTNYILTNNFTEHFIKPTYRYIIKLLLDKQYFKISKSLLKTITMKAITLSDLEDNIKTQKIYELL